MSLTEHYKTLHLLRYRFKYSTDTIYSMMPWELDIEMAMIANTLDKEIKMANST